MNRFLAPIFLLTLLFSSLAIGKTMDDLVKWNGLYYKKYTEVPFTGKTTEKRRGHSRTVRKTVLVLCLIIMESSIQNAQEPTRTVGRSNNLS
jgi:hypothetical protein